MGEPEEWTETVSYQVTHREEVWKVGEFPYWLMRTRRTTFFLFGPGFVRPDSPWIAGWQSNQYRRNAFDGSVEAETLEGVVRDLPYRVAVALLDAVKADPPVVHGASRYDHQGCRCDVCKAGKAAKAKKAREDRKARERRQAVTA